MPLVEMTIDSVRRIEEQPDYRVIILKEVEGNGCIPIWTPELEAESIFNKIKDEKYPPPHSYDFIIAVINEFEGKIDSIKISELRGDCWLARTFIKKKNNEYFEIDCCPSLALAIAVRTRAPIFAEEEAIKASQLKLDS
jgi:uncharacterized protein